MYYSIDFQANLHFWHLRIIKTDLSLKIKSLRILRFSEKLSIFSEERRLLHILKPVLNAPPTSGHLGH